MLATMPFYSGSSIFPWKHWEQGRTRIVAHGEVEKQKLLLFLPLFLPVAASVDVDKFFLSVESHSADNVLEEGMEWSECY